MCDIVFEKAKVRRGTVNRSSVYGEAAARRVLEKDVMRNFAKFTRKHLCQNLFFGVFLSILLILIIAVSIVAKGVLTNETVNYDTQTKAYVLI